MSEEVVWAARAAAAQQAMKFLVPYLYGRSLRDGLTLDQGVAKAIRSNLSYADLSRSSEFMAALPGIKAALKPLAKQYEAGRLRPGESIYTVADWVLRHLYQMTFTFDIETTAGLQAVQVRGAQMYVTVVNLGGEDWWRRLVADLYATMGDELR